MISENGKIFLEYAISDHNVEVLIKNISYSERITIALDLQILVKQLVKGVEAKTGEDIFGQIVEGIKWH
jgi:hypothetical protein